MTLEEKIERTALAVLRSGPVAPCIPGLAARRPATITPRTRPSRRQRLVLESGDVPSTRREVRI